MKRPPTDKQVDRLIARINKAAEKCHSKRVVAFAGCHTLTLLTAADCIRLGTLLMVMGQRLLKASNKGLR